MHFERDLAPDEGRIVVSCCSGVFRVLWDARARKCDGTYSTGMMGRMIGWVWWVGTCIAGKAWSACATTSYLCLVCVAWRLHTLNWLQHPHISIPHTLWCLRQQTQACPGQGRAGEQKIFRSSSSGWFSSPLMIHYQKMIIGYSYI